MSQFIDETIEKQKLDNKIRHLLDILKSSNSIENIGNNKYPKWTKK